LALQQRQATPAAVPEGFLPSSALAALHGLQGAQQAARSPSYTLAGTLYGKNASRKLIVNRL